MQIEIKEKNSNIFINRISIVSMQVSLFTGGVCSVDLYSNDKFIRNEIVPLSLEEYNQWETDYYIINLVIEKLGFERKEPIGIIEDITVGPMPILESDEQPIEATEQEPVIEATEQEPVINIEPVIEAEQPI